MIWRLAGPMILVLMLASTAGAQLPTSLDLETIRAVPVQHDGRWPPLDTLARDMVEEVTGEALYEGNDPLLVLLGWTFAPQTWMNHPLISIGNQQLREELELSADRTAFSYAELAGHQRLLTLISQLAQRDSDAKMNPLESKVSKINEKLRTLGQIFFQQVIRPIPATGDIHDRWHAIPQDVGKAPDGWKPVAAAWLQARSAFLADDAGEFAAASNALVSALDTLPAAHYPEPNLIALELRYNRLRPFRTAWMIMAAGAALAAAALAIRRKWFDAIAILAIVGGFGVLSYGLWMRWQIAGRLPAANMFESLLFLSWGMGAFAILSMFFLRNRLVPLTASFMGALSLLLADCLPLDHFVRPIAPVLLDTIWMSIHVPIIMVSYSVLTLAVLIAHVLLVVCAFGPRRTKLAETLDSLHYWYVHVGALLLLAGILTGSMWAASSWGRYWGWDPKEVWSLVAFLGYLIILHVRVDRETAPAWVYGIGGMMCVALLGILIALLGPLTGPKLLAFLGMALAMVVMIAARGRFAMAVKSILAFWLIIMTYVGVNYVLGIGLHSYAFGTGAVVRWMFLLGGADLLLVALCGLFYTVRRWREPAAEPHSSLTSVAPA